MNKLICEFIKVDIEYLTGKSVMLSIKQEKWSYTFTVILFKDEPYLKYRKDGSPNFIKKEFIIKGKKLTHKNYFKYFKPKIHKHIKIWITPLPIWL